MAHISTYCSSWKFPYRSGADGQQLWVPLLEKAYAKVSGGAAWTQGQKINDYMVGPTKPVRSRVK